MIQIDWITQDSGLPVVTAGHYVKTSYGTGHYLITDIQGPCNCTEFIAHLSGSNAPSESHFHITVEGQTGTSWLNGYRLDGTSVWSSDTLEKVAFYDI